MFRGGAFSAVLEIPGNAVLDILDHFNMPGPTRHIFHPRARFFFTEKGWKKYGKHILASLMKTEARVQVLSVKENSIEVDYKDKWQVAARPKHKKQGF